MLIDHWGRPITYLRVSVTDRCNLRCVYCMPPEGIPQVSHAAVMRYEEIAEVVRLAAAQGIRRVRLTGGEPLVRLGLPDLVRMLAAIPGIEDLSLTTNGILLERLAPALKDAGLHRVNVSLDTLDPQKFSRITRGVFPRAGDEPSFLSAWRGIEAAEAAGLTPIKINVVAMRGVNDDELRDLALLTLRRGWHVRFIELMPLSNQSSWGEGFPDPQSVYLSIPEIKAALTPLGLQPVESSAAGNGPAREYRLPGAAANVGFISPLSDHFCQQCNRLRLTADGSFRPCLLLDEEVPFLSALRSGQSILPYLQQAVDRKPAGHELAQRRLPTQRTMRQIGG